MVSTKEYCKNYYEQNKDKLLNDASELVMCGACMRTVRKSSLNIHRKSKICQKYQQKAIKYNELENLKNHWQASQPSSSMAVNFTSVAGIAENCEAAEALDADAPPAAEPEDTAFIWLLVTVDFSACVALMVRR